MIASTKIALAALALCFASESGPSFLTEYAAVAGETRTTDATPAHMEPSFVLPDNSVVSVDAVVLARSPSTDLVKTWRLAGTVKRTNGGNAEAIGSAVNIIAPAGDPGTVPWSATLTTNGSKVRVTVTGLPQTVIDWGCFIKIYADTE